MVTTLEIVGGSLALDLANSRDGGAPPARDYLQTPADVAAWARHAAGLSVDADERVLARLLELREVVDAVFRPLAAGAEPPPAALAELMTFQTPGRLVRAGRRYELTWDRDVIGPVAAAAVELLRAGPLDRLKVCHACPWLFLDLSRNRSRRWCTMSTCGASAKMRRYRAKAGRRSGSGSSA